MKLNRMIIMAVLVGTITGCSQVTKPGGSEVTWLSRAKYGVFVHYLVDENYNKAVDSFDVEQFANQMAKVNANYVIFSLGQNSGYYCSPNATYERYAGYSPGERCSRRDLPMALADALKKRDIRLMLYLPARGPKDDAQAKTALKDVDQRDVPQEHIKRWLEVIREWSLRYGNKIDGWWFDETFRDHCWRKSLPYNFKTWADICRQGNPNSLIAFNNGTKLHHAFKHLTEEQDYTAGEQDRFGATPQEYPSYPGKTWHIASYLGYGWGQADGPNYTDEWLIDYVKKINCMSGVVSIGVNVSDNGTIYPPHYRQLVALGDALSR